jgi:hypothetical protein
MPQRATDGGPGSTPAGAQDGTLIGVLGSEYRPELEIPEWCGDAPPVGSVVTVRLCRCAAYRGAVQTGMLVR